MYVIGPANTWIWTDSNRNFTLRQYGQLEYGNPDVGWIVASAAKRRPTGPKPRRRRLALRLRYFLNAYRGFAAFDLHGRSDPRL